VLPRPRFLLLLSILLWSIPLHAASTPYLVADLDTSQGGSSFGVGSVLVPRGGKVFFTASEASSGAELWSSDGTDLGTTLVRDLCPGDCSPDLTLLGKAGDTVVFFANPDPDAGPASLWRSDGTREGTFPIAPGLGACPQRSQAGQAGSTLVFTAFTAEGCGLWRTDGTADGTQHLLGIEGNFGNLFENLVAAGGKLFFLLPGNREASLWATDGTVSGTRRMRSVSWDIDVLNDQPRLLTALGSRVFFLARADDASGDELWTSDGTPGGTRPLTQFAARRPFVPTHFLKGLDGVLYFVADDVTAGADLWRSDGTVAGTRRVTDFGFAAPFGEQGFGIRAEQIAKVGDRLAFLADDGLSGRRIWTSGGTPASTEPFVCAGGCPAIDPRGPLAAVGGRLVFLASDARHGSELWVTEGASGAHLVRDLCPGACSSAPNNFFVALGRLFFLTNRLWTTDGTRQGTIQLTAIGFPPLDPFVDPPLSPLVAGGRIFFATQKLGRETLLWVSDGTPEGSGLVTVRDGGPGSTPHDLAAFQGGVTFTACDGERSGRWRSSGTAESTVALAPTLVSCFETGSTVQKVVGGLAFFREDSGLGARLWRSDGTDAGTFPVAVAGLFDGLGDPVAFHGKAAFFSKPEDAASTSLWESDGTLAGTRSVLALPDGVFAGALQVIGQQLYFVAAASPGDPGLWTSDGTVAGTLELASFPSGPSSPQPLFAAVGSTIFFVPDTAGGNFAGALWKTDGTASGTTVVLQPSGGEGQEPRDLTPFHGALFFIASTLQGQARRGLWRSDGTAAGTVLVKAVGPPAPSPARPPSGWLTPVGDQLLFVADDGTHGAELWRTDGSAAGTALVRDVAPGQAASAPRGLSASGGQLFFSADDGAHGVELWESDGSSSGTRMVQDLAPGPFSSFPAELTESGGRLYFTASDGVHGDELWALDLAGAPGCQPSDQVLCLGAGRYSVEASWQDFQGNSGSGHAVALTADTGTFWFFSPQNVEVVLKVLDGRGVNGHVWVFYGALSNVEYSLTVTDTQTGAARRYHNPPAHLGSVADILAFGPLGATGSSVTEGPPGVTGEPIVAVGRAETGGCTPAATRLCLQGGRFAVSARWRDFQDRTGVGTAVPLGGGGAEGDTGYFWFFSSDNVEVVLKVLDGRPVNGHFWVFYGALSNVEYTLTVTDTQTGSVKTYTNPLGRLGSVADAEAF
jgi:large repetitive protein